MNIKRIIWKAFSINRDELGFVLPLFLIYFLSGSFFAVGQIFSETIFLKTYGAKGFSGFFIQNGIAIILTGILYNYFFLKISMQRGFVILISSIFILILSGSAFHVQDLPWTPFYIYMANYLFTVFLDIHFFNYAFQHLTLRNSKRILPFIMGGGKLGGIISSLLIFYIFSKDISNYGMFVWAVNGGLILFPVLFFRISDMSGAGGSGIRGYDNTSDVRFFERLLQNIKLSVSSLPFVYTVLIAFIVSIINQISEYYFAKIFNEYFTTRNDLSAFLSLYTLGADLVTLFLQLFFISRLINRIGVRKANFIYPASFLSLMVFYIAFPNLLIGVLLRFFRKNVSILIRTPVFNIIMAASPRDRMVKVKSFINGVINPAGMIAGGLSILLIYKKLTDIQGYVFAVSLGGVYLFLVYLQNGKYINALKDRIKFNSKISEDHESAVSIDYSEILIDSNTGKNLDIIESIFEIERSQDFLPVLSKNYGRLSSKTKEAALDLMKSGDIAIDNKFISQSLKDDDPEIRAATLSLLSVQSRSFTEMILKENPYPDMLGGEKLAASVLLSHREKIEDRRDNDIASRLAEIKDLVLNDELEPVEFVMAASATQSGYFLNHLYELIIVKKEVMLLKSIIPYADRLTRRHAVKITYLFRNEDLNYLARFIMLSLNLEKPDKLMLLDYRDIPEKYMKSIYAYDEKSSGILLNRLFRNISFCRKSNYLKYLLIQNVVFEKELKGFIDFEIGRVKEIYELIDSMYYLKLDHDSFYFRFLNIFLLDVVDYKKHLILKAISILTGIKIDEVYDSNILLRNRDLDNYILEYIESSLKHSRELVSVFERSKLSEPPSKSHHYKKEAIPVKRYRYLCRFLPDVTSLAELCFENLFSGEISKNYGTGAKSRTVAAKEEIMVSLSIMQKILFLKENKLFSELKLDEIIHIAKIAREIDLPAERTIIRQGEKGDRLFIVIEGEVKVFTDQRILANLGPGSCIGELSIIDAEPRSASVISTKKTRILSIARDDFLLTLKDNPAISINIMQVITGRLRKLI